MQNKFRTGNKTYNIMKAISSKKEYDEVMKELFDLMNKGENNLNEDQSNRAKELALSAQKYEKAFYTIPMPETLYGMVEMKLFEKKMKQAELAEKLKLSQTKLSMILNGKQKPDIPFLKGIRKELNIDANFILDHV